MQWAKDFSQLTLEETFDRDGKLTGRREYDNGEIIQEYGYDGSGNMILYVSYSGGEMNYKTESTFDENGRLPDGACHAGRRQQRLPGVSAL